MPYSHIQSANAGTGSAQSATIAATFGATVGSGNLVAGVVTWGTATTADLQSITDNGTGGTWVIKRRISDTGNGGSSAVFYGYGWSSPPTVITATFASATTAYRGISVGEFHHDNAITTDPIDGTNEQGRQQTSPGTGADGASSGTGTLTPSVNNCLIFGGICNTGNLGSGASLIAAGSVGTEPTGAEHAVGGEVILSHEYEVQTTATARNVAFTVSQGTVTHATYMVVFAPPAAGSTITGSGTPSAQAATAAGTAERSVSGSGTPSAQSATASGTAERSIEDNGSTVELFAQAATVAGTATVSGDITGSGAPSAQSATVAGTAERSVTSSGTPAAQAATVSGTAERSVTSSGTPAAQAATTAGTGSVSGVFSASGTPSAQAATVAGTAERSVTGSGTPAAQAATTAGTGTVGDIINATGTPAAQAATASGTAERSVTSSGTVSAQAATVSGSGSISGQASASGTLSAQSATTAGTALRVITGSGTPSASSASTSGSQFPPTVIRGRVYKRRRGNLELKAGVGT